ncbi:MAG: nuclear transport factor 2 family protein [Bacteroidota bacterium]
MKALEKWHKAVAERDINFLDEILADDIVFHSPVVWSPQKGKDIAKMYLTAAMYVIANDNFSYVNELASENRACLEFTTKIGEFTINGVDLITFNDDGKIVEFKVMVRPYKGMVAMKEKMLGLLNF